jgi:hypothetical protein
MPKYVSPAQLFLNELRTHMIWTWARYLKKLICSIKNCNCHRFLYLMFMAILSFQLHDKNQWGHPCFSLTFTFNPSWNAVDSTFKYIHHLSISHCFYHYHLKWLKQHLNGLIFTHAPRLFLNLNIKAYMNAYKAAPHSYHSPILLTLFWLPWPCSSHMHTF